MSAATQWVELLRTLADPMRVRILHLLEEAASPGLRVGELSQALKLPQSTISRHVKTLIDANIAEVRRDGTSMFYRLSAATNHSALGNFVCLPGRFSAEIRKLSRIPDDWRRSCGNGTNIIISSLAPMPQNGTPFVAGASVTASTWKQCWPCSTRNGLWAI